MPTLNEIVTAAWILGCAAAMLFIAAVAIEAVRAGAQPTVQVTTVQVSTLLERTQAPASAGFGRHAADETGTWMLSQLWPGDEPHHGHHWIADLEHTGEIDLSSLNAVLAGAR